MRTFISCIPLLLVAASAQAAEPATPQGDKVMSGMSVIGNDDAPKSLVIVPWKSSELGSASGLPRGLDPGRQPVDKDVFMRELDYYQIRAASSGTGVE